MKNLTTKQKLILDYIVGQVQNPGRFPSYRDIARDFQLRSVATVAQHLNALVEKGFLVREGRQLRLVEDLLRNRGIPVLGAVQAGQPLAAEANYDGELRLEDFSRRETFAVRVQGDSMIDAGILEGDFVVVEPRETARDGEMVVAHVGEDQSVTVKYYHSSAEGIELRPANVAHHPIHILNDPYFRLAGCVVGVVRRV